MARYPGGNVCCVKNCNSSRTKHPDRHFHSIPNDERQGVWLQWIGRADLLSKTKEYLHRNYRVCSLHFEEGMYIRPTSKRLVWYAVPTRLQNGNRGQCTKEIIVQPQQEMVSNIQTEGASSHIPDDSPSIEMPKDTECSSYSNPGDKGQCTKEIISHSLQEMTSNIQTVEANSHIPGDSLRMEMPKDTDCLNYSNPGQVLDQPLPSDKGQCKIESFVRPQQEMASNISTTGANSHIPGDFFSIEMPKDTECLSYSNPGQVLGQPLPSAGYKAVSEITDKEVFIGGNREMKILPELKHAKRRPTKDKASDCSSYLGAKVLRRNFGVETWKCTLCNASFTSSTDLNLHTQIHTDITSHKSISCEASVSQACSLEKDIRSHTSKKPHKCVFCEASFSKPSVLKVHTRIHTREKPYKCSLCEASFSWSGDLKNHIRTHTGEKPFECTLCEASFSVSSSLKKHIRTHTGEKPYKCTFCDASFPDCSQLKNHTRTHTGEKPFKCSFCMASFSVSSSLIRHTRIHTGEKPFKCSFCEASFSVSSGLIRHIQMHTGGEPFKCSLCEASFSAARMLKSHMRTHTGVKPYKCCHCEASYSSSYYLKNHMRTHAGDKSYKCTLCKASFPESSDLKIHMQIHASEKLIHCFLCEASFSKSSALKRHIRNHTGETPYKCTHCEASFSESWKLKNHIWTHTGRKPHKCSHCVASFSRSGALKKHIQTHAYEKPYKCTLCGASYADSGRLKDHIQIHAQNPFLDSSYDFSNQPVNVAPCSKYSVEIQVSEEFMGNLTIMNESLLKLGSSQVKEEVVEVKVEEHDLN